jgi:putative Mn2+ efflux pump MntP
MIEIKAYPALAVLILSLALSKLDAFVMWQSKGTKTMSNRAEAIMSEAAFQGLGGSHSSAQEGHPPARRKSL